VERLEPIVFNDAWGSRVSIASLRGLPIPSPEPESEFWMGAHEAGPSLLKDRDHLDLATWLDRDPEALLGADTVARFGPRLPFLLKVLAPGKAISIQVHPTAEQAQHVRRTRGPGTYVDDCAKPELLLAIAPFEVFIGVRDAAQAAAFVGRLDVPELTAALTASAEASDPMHAFLDHVLATPSRDALALTREIVAACVRVEATDDEFGDAAAAIVRVAEEHPDDIGLAVLVAMSHRVLQPGEFVDVAAGVLHSYVRGLGIEILANSDNVVRAGLTAKEVNTAELLRIVDTAATGVAGRAREVSPGVQVFDSASEQFTLHRVDPAHADGLPGAGSPRIVFVLRGNVQLSTAESECVLRDMESVFVPFGESDVRVRGRGEVYVASVPRPHAT
jgi:mannose-6-phosphate isomerase